MTATSLSMRMRDGDTSSCSDSELRTGRVKWSLLIDIVNRLIRDI